MDAWTTAIHADDSVEHGADDVSPAIHPSTTFRYDRRTNAPGTAIYSRELFPTVTRLEKVFEGSIFAHRPADAAPSTSTAAAAGAADASGSIPVTAADGGSDGDVAVKQRHAVTYCSGLSAVTALLLWYGPKRVFVSRAEAGGYHGTLAVSGILRRFSGMEILPLEDLLPSSPDSSAAGAGTAAATQTDGETEASAAKESLRKGDLVWLESPINPHGICLNVSLYGALAASAAVPCVVDATFAPPPLYDALTIRGVTAAVHSATKYFGGHSDLLAGVVVLEDGAAAAGLREDRVSLGTIPSPQTAWLLLRSLRTFHMRIARQSNTATELVARLSRHAATDRGKRVLAEVRHSSLQLAALRDAGKDARWLLAQTTGGHTPTFSILLQTAELAQRLPSHLELYQHATSLGGVESLVEWRVLSDAHCDRRLVRLSTGCEDVEDLWHDLEQALDKLAADRDAA